MIKVESEADQVWVAKATEAGQAHIFDGWGDLSLDQQQGLMQQLQALDFQLIKHLLHQHFRSAADDGDRVVLKPPEVEPLPAQDSEEAAKYRRLGEEAIAAGKVAFVMVSGGASLGPLDEPTGFLPIGPVTGKSVFQLHAEKVRALNRRHRVSLHWWIVTRPEVDEQIHEYFRRESYFGLSGNDTVFYSQPLLPVVDRRGKFLLREPGKIALEPNGHGGVILEFLDQKRIDRFRSRGIEHIFFFHVNNPLVKIGDPVFIGHHIASSSEVTSKAVVRAHPDERLAVYCQMGGSPGVLEFSEFQDKSRNQVPAGGESSFNYCDATVHLLSLEFFQRLVRESVRLPFHARERTVPYLDKRGRLARPTEPNCVQFRFFLFDALRVAKRATVLEVPRREEFSPIKNSGGQKSPQSAQKDLSCLFARWLLDAGASFKNSGGDSGLLALEISPLFALDEWELKQKIDLPLEIDQHLFLGSRP